MRRRALIGALLLAGCRSSAAPADAAGDVAPPREAARADLARPETPRRDGTVRPEDYCALLVDSYCAFYLRCGRVEAATPGDCRAYFLETCGSRYQPYYLALVKAGLLQLSAAAVTACQGHLGTVACDQQLQDLDGPCAMWIGQQPVGGHCGIGIDSLVCAPQSSCVVTPTLCGACHPLAAVGDSCSGIEVSCGSNAACLGGTCRARVAVGGSCDATSPCIVGASCLSGSCVGPTFVGSGESCDASRRCRYGASCIGGSCRKQAMLGAACGADVPCASGRCASADAGGQTCQALLDADQPCTQGSDCLSGRCLPAGCDAIPGACFH